MSGFWRRRRLPRGPKWREGSFRVRQYGSKGHGETRVVHGEFAEVQQTQTVAETQRELIDNAIRAGRIRTIPWEDLPPDRRPNVWKKVWQWVHDK